MCSVGDDIDTEGEKYMPHITSMSTDSKCIKCQELNPCILLRGKDAYCKNCFLAGTNHKFKALLGKSKLIRPHDRVLVSYEVGHPSSALLHLLRAGLDLDTPKKLRFEPVIVFLEDQYHLTLSEREGMIQDVIKQANSFGFICYVVSFADAVVSDLQIMENTFQISEHDKSSLDKIVDKKSNATSRTDIIEILRRNVLISVSKTLDCKFIFTPELSLDIASSLLTNISLGRGSNIPLDTGFCDDRDPEVKILRPLRNFEMKEVVFYNVLHNIEPIHVRQLENVDSYSSVQLLMRRFVSDLQENYPATVTTIVKTGDKLSLDSEKCRKCQICKGNILPKSSELTAEESTNFSKLVSTSFQDPSISGQERYTQIVDNFQMETNTEHCYSCAKIAEYLLDP